MVRQSYGLINRLKKREEERKILMVISDGAPVDDSTLSVNSGDLFGKTFKKNCQIHRRTKVILRFLAIGIGHDVSRYYSKAIKITDVQELGDVMISELSGHYLKIKENLIKLFFRVIIVPILLLLLLRQSL